jgi:hypothetical protein
MSSLKILNAKPPNRIMLQGTVVNHVKVVFIIYNVPLIFIDILFIQY